MNFHGKFLVVLISILFLIAGCGDKKADPRSGQDQNEGPTKQEAEELSALAEQKLEEERARKAAEEQKRLEAEELKKQRIEAEQASAKKGKVRQPMDKVLLEEALPEDLSERFIDGLQIVYFEYDKSLLLEDAQQKIQDNFDWIQSNKEAKLQLEGHADERGTNEYNMALGEERAKAVLKHLVSLGADPANFVVIGFGEERPAALGHNETSWRKNRRVEFTFQP